jgi:hypothetical protein
VGGGDIVKGIRLAVKAAILAVVFVASMVGLYLLGWDVGQRRPTIWLLAVPMGITFLLLNWLWPDMRARVQWLLATNQDWDAANILKRMAGRGDSWAQTQLAALYVADRGVDRDYHEAIRLLTAASERGYAPALTGLGIAYRDGLGVDSDLAKAADFFTRAAKNGDTAARAALASLRA